MVKVPVSEAAVTPGQDCSVLTVLSSDAVCPV
jgi:hypothetical protein